VRTHGETARPCCACLGNVPALNRRYHRLREREETLDLGSRVAL
jgi:hypothetical protein